jgi:hypothetical protein
MPSMPHSENEPETGASAEAIEQGFEPLSTRTTVLVVIGIMSAFALAGIFWGLWVLLGFYLREPRVADAQHSVAPILLVTPPAPLEPMTQHNDLDWQDLVHLRQQQDEQLRKLGMTLDPRTGEAIVPPAIAEAITDRYSRSEAPAPLRFPPVMAPVQAGADEPLSEADVFPPVGAAAEAEETRPSIYRPAPGPRDINDLPTQSGPPGAHDRPTQKPNIQN